MSTFQLAIHICAAQVVGGICNKCENLTNFSQLCFCFLPLASLDNTHTCLISTYLDFIANYIFIYIPYPKKRVTQHNVKHSSPSSSSLRTQISHTRTMVKDEERLLLSQSLNYLIHFMRLHIMLRVCTVLQICVCVCKNRRILYV